VPEPAGFSPRDLDAHVVGCSTAHQRLLADIGDRDEEWCRQDSTLPGWSRGHVLSHVARNAEGLARLLEFASRGEVGEQYPGGVASRNKGIEDGARRSARELVADVRSTIYLLEGAWAMASAETWEGSGILSSGAVIPVREVVFRRWREVEVHHADLLASISFADWTPDYVRLDLEYQVMQWRARKPMGLTVLPDRALRLPPHDRLAWLLGRLEVDGLAKPEMF
jgi:maleylpyruvate isomerase